LLHLGDLDETQKSFILKASIEKQRTRDENHFIVQSNAFECFESLNRAHRHDLGPGGHASELAACATPAWYGHGG
jgi:hypothetical protein